MSIVTAIKCDACGRNSTEPPMLEMSRRGRVTAGNLRVAARVGGWIVAADGLRDGSGAGTNDFCGECYAAAPSNYGNKNQDGFKYSVIKPAKKQRLTQRQRSRLDSILEDT